MRYVDTSVFVPFFVLEAASARVEEWFARVGPSALAVSSWTVVEFVSAIGMKVRARALTSGQGAAIVAHFRVLVRRSLRMIEPAAEDFAKAAWLMERFDLGLRAGDALHAAVAQNANASSLVTLDKTLAYAAGKIGLSCEMPA